MSALLAEIDQTITPTPTLWWLGQSGFIVRFATITFYIDPCLSAHPHRRVPAPLDPAEIRHADMILATHAGHLDAATLLPMLEKSKTAKLVLPKSSSDFAHAAGIPYARMTTTDSDLRVEYFKDNLYGRIYAVPSAHPQLDWSASGGYPYLGYLIRFGRWTIYHAGDCALYSGLADRLRPFNVNVALLPVGGKNFSVAEAAQLASDIGAGWVVPMHYGTFGKDGGEENDFIAHMLGHRPEQQFKVFKVGERWTVPED
ncbi:MAG: MBL fold metallo-hydrolase [Acidobacteriia bacterium]|nr:MBL fold metallo-hydrolase [Terriglobia bacterium]